MSRRANQRRARKPSAHQRRIRFFIGLSFVIIIVVTAALYWLLNRPGFFAH
jgi:cell division septal protein FtsQ